MPDVTRIKHGPFEYDTLPGEEGLLSGTMPGYVPQFILGSDPETGLHGKLGDRFFHGLTHPELMGLLSKNTGEFPTLYKNSYGLMGAVSRLKTSPQVSSEEAKTAAIKEALVFSGLARKVETGAQRLFGRGTQSVPQVPRAVPTPAASVPAAPVPAAPAHVAPAAPVSVAPVAQPTARARQELAYAPTQAVTAQTLDPMRTGQGLSTSEMMRNLHQIPGGIPSPGAKSSASDRIRKLLAAGPSQTPNPVAEQMAAKQLTRWRPQDVPKGLPEALQGAWSHPQGATTGIHDALTRYGLAPKKPLGSLGEYGQYLNRKNLGQYALPQRPEGFID